MPDWLRELAPILILLAAVAVVIARLPKVEGLGHSDAFRRRRVLNWLPLGLTYAFLYMGRYNLKVSKMAFEDMQNAAGHAVMGNADFAFIFGVGVVVYGVSFVINGPLTDRFGGKRAILVGAGGSLLMNALMGLATLALLDGWSLAPFVSEHFRTLFSVLYGANMYFQSFGAVAIVKVNAPWFHVRERGVFGAIFGILISLGIYFAFDWSYFILEHFGSHALAWVFGVPTLLLAVFWTIDLLWVKDTPGRAGFTDFDTGDASSGDDGPQMHPIAVFRMMLRNKVIMTIAAVEFCSGFLRQAIMQWYRTFAKQTDAVLHLKGDFVYDNWGMLLCVAGILGGVVAGVISDHVFGSRRGPVAALLYGLLLLGAIALSFVYTTPAVGWLVVFMSMAVIGVHGMMSGTASMDFGGRRNAGIAVGIIDGFVYLGTGAMSLTYFLLLPEEEFDAAGNLTGPVLDPKNWIAWPLAMIPFAALGLFLATRLWNARPKGLKAAAGH